MVITNPGMDMNIDLNSSTVENYMYLVDRYAIYGPYCKLFNRQIIEENQIRFNEALKSAEDFDFNIRYIEYIRYIQTNSKSQYFYRIGYKQGVAHFIDDSAIISCHIMGEGLIKLAKRMGIYEKCFDAISYRIAEKHWLTRLPMIFVQDRSISRRIRKEMYMKLRGDAEYRSVCRAGIAKLPVSSVTKLCTRMDSFIGWQFYFALYKLLRN